MTTNLIRTFFLFDLYINTSRLCSESHTNARQQIYIVLYIHTLGVYTQLLIKSAIVITKYDPYNYKNYPFIHPFEYPLRITF